MQGMKMSLRSRTFAVMAAVVACGALGVSLAAGGAGASENAHKDFSFDCVHDAIQVTQSGNRLDARGKLRCSGSGIRRQVLRVCLLQTGGPRPVVVKCVVRARNGSGQLSAVASRRCAKGPYVGFMTRIKIRIRKSNGKLLTDQATASPNRFPRDCTPG